jgi:hypothetical protein
MNKIVSIEIKSVDIYPPEIYIYRNYDKDLEPNVYPCYRADNGFNGRRFLRGVQMAAELYRRQADASGIHDSHDSVDKEYQCQR